MNKVELKNLYNALIGNGYTAYDLGDYNTFSDKMKNEQSRKQLYDYVSSSHNIGSYEEYEKRLTQAPISPIVADSARYRIATQMAENLQDDTRRDATLASPNSQQFSTLDQAPEDTLQWLDTQNKQRQNKLNSQNITNINAIQEQKSQLQQKYNDILDAQPDPHPFNTQPFGSNLPKDATYYSQAIAMLDDAQHTLDTAHKIPNSNPLQNFGRGAARGLFDMNTLTLGLDELFTNTTLLGILDKADSKGIEALSDAEEALINAAIVKQVVDNSTDLGRSYLVGRGFTENLPYMIEFAISGIPAGALTKGATKKITNVMAQLARKAAEKTTSRFMRGAAQQGAKFATGLAKGSLRAAAQLPMQASTYNTLAERKIGQLDYADDAQGNLTYVARENEDTPEALAKTVASAFTTNLVETFGGNVIADLASIPIRNLANAKAWQSLSRSLRQNKLVQFAQAAGYQGAPAEFFEEMIDSSLNAIITGDQSIADVYAPDNIINTAGVTLLTSLFIGSAAGITTSRTRSRVNREYTQASGDIVNAGYTPTQIEQLTDIALGTPTQVSNWLAGINNEINTLIQQSSTDGSLDDSAQRAQRIRQLISQRDFVLASAQYQALIGGMRDNIRPAIDAATQAINAQAHEQSGYTIKVFINNKALNGYLHSGNLDITTLPDGTPQINLNANIYQVAVPRDNGEIDIIQATPQDIVIQQAVPTETVLRQGLDAINQPLNELIAQDLQQAVEQQQTPQTVGEGVNQDDTSSPSTRRDATLASPSDALSPSQDISSLSDTDFDTHIDSLTPTEAISAIALRRGADDADQYATWKKAALTKQRDAAQKKLTRERKPFDASRYPSFNEMKAAERQYNTQIEQEKQTLNEQIATLNAQLSDIEAYLIDRNKQIAAEREAENPLQGGIAQAVRKQPINTLEQYIAREIALGARLRLSDNTGNGLAAELGITPGSQEHRELLSILSNTEGLTPEQWAEYIIENIEPEYAHLINGRDTQDIRNAIIDTIHDGVTSRRRAYQFIADINQQQADAERQYYENAQRNADTDADATLAYPSEEINQADIDADTEQAIREYEELLLSSLSPNDFAIIDAMTGDYWDELQAINQYEQEAYNNYDTNSTRPTPQDNLSQRENATIQPSQETSNSTPVRQHSNNVAEIQPQSTAPAYPRSTRTDVVGRSLSADEAQSLITQMENNATTAPEVELTPENWLNLFGEDGTVETPIGAVKMGENQYLKLYKKNRTQYLGMIKPTLNNPDIVLEEYDPKDNAERQTKYLFIKTFIKEDGSRYVHFESVTVKKDNLEVSISSHEVNELALTKKVQQSKLLYLNSKFLNSDGRLIEPLKEGSDLVPTPNSISDYNKIVSNSKDSERRENNKISSLNFSSEPNPILSKDTNSSPISNNFNEKIAQASADVNTNPTEAQKEAGNYKKGHVKIGSFDITIEQPKGSVRSGVDADGNKWENTMQNTYGYIRGTEGVDGDHIDVFLSNDLDSWNGRRIYVVDQYNKDGSFDEHKVMLGFNDSYDAEEAYTSNYNKDWQGQRAITSVSLEEFEKWLASSHRKTKPFAHYRSVQSTEEHLKDSFIPPAADDVKVDESESSTRTDETLASPSESEQVSDQDNAPYTITPAQYTTKRGNVLDMHLVKFTNDLTKEQYNTAKQLAKAEKGWYDREKGGFMMRNEQSANRLADTILNNSDAVSNAQPVSMTEIQSINDGDTVFTEPQQPTTQNGPIWQYAVTVDTDGYTVLTRDDVSTGIPIGDALFSPAADSPQEMLDILRNPLNGMQEVLDAVEVTLENKIKTRELDRKIKEERRREYEALRANGYNGYKIGDEVIYKGKKAKIHDFEEYGEHSPVLDTGLAPIMYELAQWSDIKKTTAQADASPSQDVALSPLSPSSPSTPSNQGQFNLVSDERMDELRERLRRKLRGQMNIGIDPEILSIGLEIAVGHIDRGIKSFTDFARVMIDDLGDTIRPYLKAFYNGARELPEVVETGLADEMTPYSDVQQFDVANFDKPGIDAFATAETVTREAEVAQEVEVAQERIKKTRSVRKQSEKKAVSSQEQTGGLFDELFAETNKADAELHRQFAMTVKADMLAALDNGTKPYRSILDLRKRASDLGMEVDNDGRTDILLQELVEDGLVRAAREVIGRKGRNSRASYDLICKLYEMQPTIAARSSNRIKMQQYSTPLPMAWIANRFAMANKADGKVLEPTAGNGMLVFTVPVEQVHANELDETRLDNLREQGFAEVTQQDATEPFEGGMQYDVVIANPPFGKREAVEYDGKMIPGLDPQITLNALASMKDDGRAAIIIGGNMEYASNGAIKSMKPFFTYLYDHYNVKGVIDMSGGLYAKQGTTFPTRMILIEGRRSDEERAQTAVYPPVESKAIRKSESFDDLYEIINEVLNSKEKTNGTEILRSRERQLASVNNETSGNTDGAGHREQPRKNDDVGSRGNRTERNSGRGEQVLPRERRTNNADGETRTETSRNNAGGSRRVSDTDIQRVGTERVSTSGVGLTQTPTEHKKRTLTDEKSAYRPHNSAFSLNSVAPAAMVEAMDNVLTQIEAQHGSIDEFIRTELGYDTIEEAHQSLAAEQMDSVAMAIYQMKQGQALIIGDQTGVGKGRQMAALIRWAVQRGEKPVFITQKADLFSDIYRDLVDVGSGDLVPFIFNSDGAMVDSKGNTVHKPLSSAEMAKVFASGTLPDEYDFAVLTYSQVNTGDAISQQEMEEAAKKSGARTKKSKNVKNGKATPKATFLRAIAEDNYLFLDESHTAAGSSNTGAYLQSILRTAKAATFASATFAKRPDTMPLYAIRTAMSQAKVEPDKMISIIEKGGVTLQEIMSRELTNAGQMVRRERDMSDVVTDWKTITDPETVRRARENYDRTIAAFNAIIKFQEDYVKPMIEALDMELAVMAESAGVKRGTDKMGVENVPFASKTYNYTKQLMLALKVDAIADEVEAEINAGRHPVIALESTMESSIKDYAAGEIIDEPTFSASLLKGLDTVMQYTVKDEDGNERHERYSPQALGPAGEKAYYELQDFIRESTSDIFISPLDAIIERLHEKGYKVGELTGRNMYVERNEDGRVVVKRRTDKDKKRMQREFNSGVLDVLILNKSASTGISLHASEKFSDQRQRSMIIAQPLSDINDYMQMIGRIDRTGQVHRGYYINLGLPVPAENRFLMMLSTKLKSLNANTTTSQDSESNDVEAPDLLNKYGSQVVVEYLRDNVEIYEKMGTPLKKGGLGGGRVQASELDEYKPQEDDARKVTGYVALLTTKEQEEFYDDVVRRYNELIKYLNDTGSNDLRINVMPLRAKTIERRVSSEGIDPNGSNPFARNSYVVKVEMDVLRKPMKADEIRKVIEQINRGIAPAEYLGSVIETIRKEDEARIAAEEERYEKAKAKAVEDIAKQTDKINVQKKRSEEEKRVAIENFIAETNEKVEAKHNDNILRLNQSSDQMMHRLRMFEVGKSYLVPDNLESMIFDFATPSIFCGYKTKDSKITASTTLAVFATLDGRRRIEIKLSQIDALRSIDKMTDDNWDAARATTLDNWDSQIPSETRKTGFIMTGNILQAIADTQDEYGGYPGQLISYTDIDGNVHDGILMPDKWNASMLKTSGAPLSSRLQQIKDYVPITSHDGKVEIMGSSWAKMFYLTVPKTKKDGAVYYENKTLLRAAGGNFYPYRGKLRADIPEDRITEVVKELTKLGVKVKEERTDDDTLYRSDDTMYRVREDEAPKNTGIGYKVFVLKNGELFPPMVANPNGEATPVGVWLDADAAPIAGQSKTGRTQVKAGGKGTQGGSGKLAYRPGWHLGEIPYALQFNRNDENGERTLFPANFVWAEVEYANDVDYQEEAMSYGYNQNGKFQHSYAGLPRVPENGAYKYRTNPNPETDPWIITGAMRVKRLLTPTEVDEIVKAAGREPQRRQEGAITDKQINALNAEIANDYRDGVGAYTDDEVSFENDPISKVLGKPRFTRKQRREYAERERQRMVARVDSLAKKLHLDNVEIVTEASALQGKKQRAKGFYSKSTGKITIVIPNHRSTFDVEQTLLHEAVAHYGLRQLFGEHFDTFLDNVFNNADEAIRRRIVELATKNGWDFRKATEEYLAMLAENTEFEAAHRTGWWQQIKDFFLNMLHKIGFEDFRGVTLTDNELRYILWRSYENLAEPGRYRSILGEAADVAKQYELKVGNYAVADNHAPTAAESDDDLYRDRANENKSDFYKIRPKQTLTDSNRPTSTPDRIKQKFYFRELDDTTNSSSNSNWSPEEQAIAQATTPILNSKGTFLNLSEAEKWARENLQGQSAVNNFTGDTISISRKSVNEMLAPKFAKSVNEKTHMAALQSVLDFIKTGIPAEIHPDTHGRRFDVMRLYNAIEINGHIYRVKSTVRKVKQGDNYYTYEIQEMELLEDTQDALGLLNAIDGRQLNSNNSITGAKLLKGVKKTNSNENILHSTSFRTSSPLDVAQQVVAQDMPRRIAKRAKQLADRLGVNITIINTYDDLRQINDDYAYLADWLEGKIDGQTHRYAGLFSNDDKRIIIFSNVIRNMQDPLAEVEKTITHEVVAHYGLRRLLGEEGLANFLSDVWQSLPTEKQIRWGKYAMNIKRTQTLSPTELATLYSDKQLQQKAAEEYIANISEQGVTTPTLWQRICAAFRRIMRRLGFYNYTPTESDIHYILAQSYSNLRRDAGSTDATLTSQAVGEGGNQQDALQSLSPSSRYIADNTLSTLDDIAEQYNLHLDEQRQAFAEAITPQPTDDPITTAHKVRFREVAEFVTRDNTAYEQFLDVANDISDAINENDARHGRKRTTVAEAHYDSMQRLKNLIDDIGTKQTNNNPYITQNQARSRAQALTRIFNVTHLPEIYDAVTNCLQALNPNIDWKNKDQVDKQYNRLSIYLQARTALERQAIKEEAARAEAEANGEEYIERDFAGLAGVQTAIFDLYDQYDETVKAVKRDREKLAALAQDREVPTVQEFVESIEKEVENYAGNNQSPINSLWNAIQKVSEFQLDTSYEAGVISRSGYQTLTYGVSIDNLLKQRYEEQRKAIIDHPGNYDNVTDYDKDGNATGTRKQLNSKAQQDLYNLANEYAEAVKQVPMPTNMQNDFQRLIETGWLTAEEVASFHRYYQYYTPLKGHAELTAEDVVEYEQKTPRNQSKVKSVQGHTQLAKDPLNQLILDTHGAIQSAEQNRWRRDLYNLLSRNPNSKQYTIQQRYYRVETNINGDKELVPYGTIEHDELGEEIFVPGVPTPEELANGTAVAFNNRNTEAKVDIPIRRSQHDEHTVTVLVDGEPYSIFFYDKRIADAVNGRNIKYPRDIWRALEKLQGINRLYAGLKTSLNPTFTLISNLPRDWAEMTSNNFIAHGAQHALTSFIYRLRATWVGDVQRAVSRYQSGELVTIDDAKTETERYVMEFITNGGQVNITQLPDYEDARVNLAKDLQYFARKGKMPKGFILARIFNDMAERVELAPRLATYIASRKIGLSIAESINDAKEATVNFDRKGSWSGIMGLFQLFYNASAQSVRRQIQLAQKHPIRFTATYAVIGLTTTINNIMISWLLSSLLAGDDEDKKHSIEDVATKYFAVNPELRRHYNVIMLGDTYIRIPMAINYLPYVTLGDVLADTFLNPNSRKQHLKNTLDVTSAILDTFTPSMIAQPIGFAFDAITARDNRVKESAIQAMTMSALNKIPVIEPLVQSFGNYNFMGGTLYDTPFNRNTTQPAYIEARAYTQPIWILASRTLNDITGGNEVRAGWANIPAESIENVMSIFGGFGEYGENIASLAQLTYEAATGSDVKASDWIKSSPLISRLYGGNANERYDKAMQSLFYDDMSALAKFNEYRKNADTPELMEDFNHEYTPDEQRYFADLNTMQRIHNVLKREERAKQNADASDLTSQNSRTDATLEGDHPNQQQALYELANTQFQSLASGHYQPVNDPYYIYMYMLDAIRNTPYTTQAGEVVNIGSLNKSERKQLLKNDKVMLDMLNLLDDVKEDFADIDKKYYPGKQLDDKQQRLYDQRLPRIVRRTRQLTEKYNQLNNNKSR